MSAKEDRIREFAYQIWESEGKPHGQAKRHWEMATKLVEAEQTPGKATPKRVSKPKAAAEGAAPAAPIKPRASKATPKADTEKPALLKPAKAPAKAKPSTTPKPAAKKPKA
ncbi:DUF2934 domain-containing protein [Pseudomonas sp. CNPSo 3701]|uniref:DUF2934 domain-containing protein n=1 Tax=Pseudomonas sp. CNPSo 3701 TaxID=3027943 RepID=UPI0023643292|nr:DUF2934 domain-containing protein [Pseudomonas sp. CNPSo 3701]MDD1508079.1 DUF2934 domain-containing protein [Pseudomonas sp. CNPSo 3701]